jgi:hypothetical protein
MTEVSIGNTGRTYLQGVLRQCEGAACDLAEIVAKPGRIFAPLPPGTTEARALKFDVGGLSSRTTAFSWLLEYLRRKPDGTLVLQDVWSQPSDLRARRPNYTSYVADDRQVYYYLRSHALNFDNLVDLHKQISSFQSVGFYIAEELALSDEQQRQHKIPAGYFDQFVDLTVAVCMSAYDQESWIVWEAAT